MAKAKKKTPPPCPPKVQKVLPRTLTLYCTPELFELIEEVRHKMQHDEPRGRTVSRTAVVLLALRVLSQTRHVTDLTEREQA